MRMAEYVEVLAYGQGSSVSAKDMNTRKLTLWLTYIFNEANAIVIVTASMNRGFQKSLALESGKVSRFNHCKVSFFLYICLNFITDSNADDITKPRYVRRKKTKVTTTAKKKQKKGKKTTKGKGRLKFRKVHLESVVHAHIFDTNRLTRLLK